MKSFILQTVQMYGGYLVILMASVFAIFLFRKYQYLRKKIEKFNVGVALDEFGSDGLGFKFREICLNYDEYLAKKASRLVLKVEPNSFLIGNIKEEFEKSYLYRVAGIFTGFSLVFTFLLIGHSVHDIGEYLPTINKNNLSLLGNPIKELQEKFYVSIAGILCTIAYQGICAFLMRRLSNYANQELNLRDKVDYIVRESQDLFYQDQQARGAEGTLQVAKNISEHLVVTQEAHKSEMQEIKELLKSLSSINVTVGSFAESVTTKLENSIDRTIGDKLTELIKAQNASTERIANQIGEVLSKSIGNELEKAFSELSSKLPNIMSNGAGEATSRMADAITQASSAFQGVSSSMPVLITQMSLMLTQIENQQTSSNEASQRVNNGLLNSLQEATSRMSEQNSRMLEQQSEIVKTLRETISDINTNVRASSTEMQTSLQNGAGQFSDKVKFASEGISHSLQGMSSLMGQVEKMASNLRDINKDLLSEFSNSISEMRTVTTSMAITNGNLDRTLASLAEVATQLNHAPVVTQSLVDATSSALHSQRQNIEGMLSNLSTKTDHLSKTLSEQYSRGVEMVARTFVDKIGEIEGQTKNIRGVYTAAGQTLATSMEPLEELNENIQELNRSLKSMPGLKNT